jgi:carbon-monoxide dehydrogenase small subunit
MVLALECEGATVRTIESEYQNGRLSDLQEAFIAHNAFQCGFCTPGMIMSARALLEANPNPSRDEIKEAMEGNLCRCTGYESIIAAIESLGASKQ